MSKIVLDFGSGNTCDNELPYIRNMLDSLAEVDSLNHQVIVKWQLFKSQGNNKRLSHISFDYAYNYAKTLGFQTTASVFDIESADFLLKNYDIPFIKISCNRHNYMLIDYIGSKVPIYASYSYYENQNNSINKELSSKCDVVLACIPKYPSLPIDYKRVFSEEELSKAISDHTDNFKLFKEYNPRIIEWHYKLEDSTGLDSGTFARTPEQLKEVL